MKYILNISIYLSLHAMISMWSVFYTYTESVSSEVIFLEDVLQSLRDLKRGKIDWSEMDVNDLVNKFLKDPKECMKMVVDELNLIGNLIQTYTGIKVFNVSDNKSIKINKLMANLQTSSQELITTSHR